MAPPTKRAEPSRTRRSRSPAAPTLHLSGCWLRQGDRGYKAAHATTGDIQPYWFRERRFFGWDDAVSEGDAVESGEEGVGEKGKKQRAGLEGSGKEVRKKPRRRNKQAERKTSSVTRKNSSGSRPRTRSSMKRSREAKDADDGMENVDAAAGETDEDAQPLLETAQVPPTKTKIATTTREVMTHKRGETESQSTSTPAIRNVPDMSD